MLMSRGDTGKKRKKEVSPVAAWLRGPLELMCFPVWQESASLKDDAVLSDILKQMEPSREKGGVFCVCSPTSPTFH